MKGFAFCASTVVFGEVHMFMCDKENRLLLEVTWLRKFLLILLRKSLTRLCLRTQADDELKISASGKLCTSRPKKSDCLSKVSVIRQPGKKTSVFQVSQLLPLLRSSFTSMSCTLRNIYDEIFPQTHRGVLMVHSFGADPLVSNKFSHGA